MAWAGLSESSDSLPELEELEEESLLEDELLSFFFFFDLDFFSCFLITFFLSSIRALKSFVASCFSTFFTLRLPSPGDLDLLLFLLSLSLLSSNNLSFSLFLSNSLFLSISLLSSSSFRFSSSNFSRLRRLSSSALFLFLSSSSTFLFSLSSLSRSSTFFFSLLFSSSYLLLSSFPLPSSLSALELSSSLLDLYCLSFRLK